MLGKRASHEYDIKEKSLRKFDLFTHLLGSVLFA